MGTVSVDECAGGAPAPKRRCVRGRELPGWWRPRDRGRRAGPRERGCFAAHAAVCPRATLADRSQATELLECSIDDGLGGDARRTFCLQCPWCLAFLYRCDVCGAVTAGGRHDPDAAEGRTAEEPAELHCEDCGVLLAFLGNRGEPVRPEYPYLRDMLMRLPPLGRFTLEETLKIQVDAFGRRAYVSSKARNLARLERQLQEIDGTRNDTPPGHRAPNSSGEVDCVLKTPMGTCADGGGGGDEEEEHRDAPPAGDTPPAQPVQQPLDEEMRRSRMRRLRIDIERHRQQIRTVGTPSFDNPEVFSNSVIAAAGAADAVLIEQKAAYIIGCCEALGIADGPGVIARAVEWCKAAGAAGTRGRKRAPAVAHAESALRMSVDTEGTREVIACARELLAAGSPRTKAATDDAAMQSTAEMISRVFESTHRRALSADGLGRAAAARVKEELNGVIRELSQVCSRIRKQLRTRGGDDPPARGPAVSSDYSSEASRIAALRDAYAWVVQLYRSVDAAAPAPREGL